MSQFISGSRISSGGHSGKNSCWVLQSIWYGSLCCGSHSGSVGAVPENISGDFHSCGEISHWFRECPRRKLVVQTKLAYIPRQPRAPEVCFDGGEDSHFSRECPRRQLVR